MHAIPEPVVAEARAEIIWGKSRDQVCALLEGKGVGNKEALTLIAQLLAERTAIIRAEGRKKIGWGVVLALALLGYFILRAIFELREVRTYAAVLVPVGIYGVGKIIKGLTMVMRPGGTRGDLADSE